MKTLKNRIIAIMKRNKNGLTVSELTEKLDSEPGFGLSPLSSIRARTYELANTGDLRVRSMPRPSATNGVPSKVFTAY